MGGTTALSAAAANAETVFVSVMEFSAGEDLDTHLKRVRCMPESHARAVFMQIVAGLRHLAELREPIIHYDLKPANIIFHSSLQTCLDVKITDFGLSKIIVEGSANEDGHIEQTSPGAGTYWYLPPECFLDGSGTGNGNQAQMISAKVDIWAAGIILYQMLYGRRPFSHDDSQRRIWQEKLIVQQAQKPLEFPDRPVVSQACKDLIRRCLTYNTNDRPDIFALSNDPYLRMASRRRPRAATPAGGGAGGGAHLAVPSSIAPSAFEFQVPAPPGAKK
jgi:tousled-like kinase